MFDLVKEIMFGFMVAIFLIPLGLWIGLSVMFSLMKRDIDPEIKKEDIHFDIFGGKK